MKLSFSPRLSPFLKPSLFTNLHRSVCSASSIPPPPTTPKPQTPLFLRPPTHSATTSDLQKWHDWANTLASSVGSTFVDLDNGPDSTVLRRELKWLMEDAIEETKNVDNNDGSVRLRVEIEELYMLWKQRVEERRPFQYVVGCEHWRDLVLCVEEGVLIPRPETELIVDLVGGVVLGNEGLREGLWADLGTGSGAIAIGIARVLGSGGRVIATDLSPTAIGVAALNVQRYGLQDIVELRQGSWFGPLKDVEGKLSGFVSNPPYIPSDNIAGLQAEVGRHEPRVALDGGVNGMDDLLHLCKGAAFMLKPGGFFAFETNGEEQCKYLVEYMENDAGGSFCNLNIVADFAGINRFVTGFRR
ncbi:release factor glutamine methyltransferase [Pyrus x bretschneideri]|uniref:release factor glutamine methyltransferase n=1 Tax=Pyrus x bretschneideri TaxID=225117 RepID=UPI002030795A|nr:release factor glutamine methyltransferase [Pyrus x bretschneideri]